jgi:hypothetical protein
VDEPDDTADEPDGFDEPDDTAVVWGWLFLAAGLLIVAWLVVHGIGVARSTRPGPDMAAPAHIVCTLTLGPFALILIAGALRMIRRKRWD